MEILGIYFSSVWWVFVLTYQCCDILYEYFFFFTFSVHNTDKSVPKAYVNKHCALLKKFFFNCLIGGFSFPTAIFLYASTV